MTDYRLYVIVSGSHADPVDLTHQVVAGGAGVVQLRDKRGHARHTLELARTMAAICKRGGARLVVNDRVDIAIAAGADGVHLGPSDLPVADARRLAPPDFLIGASAGTVELATSMVASGADYIGFGAVYDARGSKPEAVHGRGVDALRAVVEAIDQPVVAIGGIRREHVAEVAATGAAGVAVIRAIAASSDPQARAVEFLRDWIQYS